MPAYAFCRTPVIHFVPSVALLQAGLLLINCLHIFQHFCVRIHILGCLVISHFCKFWYFKILFNIRFSRYKLGFSPSWLKSLSVIRNRNLFHSLITGKNQLYLYETSRPCELKVVFKGIWQPPALPYRLQYSTIGRLGLNHRVRDENGCVP